MCVWGAHPRAPMCSIYSHFSQFDYYSVELVVCHIFATCAVFFFIQLQSFFLSVCVRLLYVIWNWYIHRLRSKIDTLTRTSINRQINKIYDIYHFEFFFCFCYPIVCKIDSNVPEQQSEFLCSLLFWFFAFTFYYFTFILFFSTNSMACADNKGACFSWAFAIVFLFSKSSRFQMIIKLPSHYSPCQADTIALHEI